jgi:Cu/Ag efflux protein CusF
MPTTLVDATARRKFMGTAIVLTLIGFPSAQVQAQASSTLQGRLYAEIVQINVDKKTVTLKAVMGHKTLRVARAEMLEGFKEGDQVLFEVGQDGTEVIITILSLARK